MPPKPKPGCRLLDGEFQQNQLDGQLCCCLSGLQCAWPLHKPGLHPICYVQNPDGTITTFSN